MKYGLGVLVLLINISLNAQNLSIENNIFTSSFNYHTEPDLHAARPAVVKKDKIIYVKENIRYADHLFEASSFNIPLINDYKSLDLLVSDGQLIEVPEEGNGYILQKLTYSRPVLHPEALTIMNEISDLFFSETSKKLSISSLTRTMHTQKKLSRVNSNAAIGESAHAYGAAFDISYSQYNGVRGRNFTYEKKLQEILDSLVEEGKIYYIKEKSQPCFHVTVRNPNLVFPDDYPVEDILNLIMSGADSHGH